MVKELLVDGIKSGEVEYIVFERRVSFDSKIENRDWTAFEISTAVLSNF